MQAELLVSRILDDERLTRDLEEADAIRLNDWLIRQAQHIAATSATPEDAWPRMDALCRRGRALAAHAVGLGPDQGSKWLLSQLPSEREA